MAGRQARVPGRTTKQGAGLAGPGGAGRWRLGAGQRGGAGRGWARLWSSGDSSIRERDESTPHACEGKNGRGLGDGCEGGLKNIVFRNL